MIVEKGDIEKAYIFLAIFWIVILINGFVLSGPGRFVSL